MALAVGQTFGDYEVLGELGRGGMGAVYQARQISLQRLVALKVLPPHLADQQSAARFQTEAIAAAHLNHANVVQVFAAGEENGMRFIAMEFVDGENIEQRIRRCGRLPMTESLDIAYHVAVALDHAWQSAHLIHRDIKPENIFLAASGTVKLGDFGLAKFLREGAAGVTNTGHAMGTPQFISPEQAHGKRDIDFRADIYSLGCALHYMMTGRMVFEGPDFLSIALKHVNETPEPLSTLLVDPPEAVQALLDRMLSKDPEARHGSYAELIEDLLHGRQAAAEWQAQNAARRERLLVPAPSRRSRWLYAFAALIPFIVAAMVIGDRWPALIETKPARPPLLVDPSDRRDFIDSVRHLTPVARLDSVMIKLREANPAFRGKERYTVDGDVVTELSFSSAGVSNLWPLVALPHLRVLRIAGDAANNRPGSIVDLSPLAELSEIEELDCSANPVRDLEPLSGLPLTILRCANTRVESLEPLRDLNLIELDISGTQVRDVAALAHMQLIVLRCNRTRVRDLSPLREAPMEVLVCEPRMLHAGLLNRWHNLEKINGLTPVEFTNRFKIRRERARTQAQ